MYHVKHIGVKQIYKVYAYVYKCIYICYNTNTGDMNIYFFLTKAH